MIFCKEILKEIFNFISKTRESINQPRIKYLRELFLLSIIKILKDYALTKKEDWLRGNKNAKNS
ncbi:MAG: hypothetical protein MRECE_6c039 [Mycoplasmataceae bacterium CE_OT135]|nr:MAG: hypothetical protein MRECE_17c011 [Mycoplasmataceae bacterium CE_OT135]KLL03934.1 MAG: hypothetical protein MRECE_6c039 [Mycoplasmataceae bacterium CE_OT135]